MRQAAALATGDWERLRKARDFHRLHHKRVTQEKDKLLADVKRLRTHYAQARARHRESQGSDRTGWQIARPPAAPALTAPATACGCAADAPPVRSTSP